METNMILLLLRAADVINEFRHMWEYKFLLYILCYHII